ncbi:signal peptidase I [Streptococcus hongkongensis]|nr:hypothetical protein NC01_09885 [Streptococcus uberis]
MRKLTRFFKFAISSYIIFYLTFSMIYTTVFLDSNRIVKYLGWKPYVVLSSSMQPKINRGDVVVATWKNPELLSYGDIIVTKPKNYLTVVHYFAGTEIRDNKLYIRTRRLGAVNKEEWDYWKLSYNHYIGKSSFKIPWIGNLIIFLTTPIGVVSLLVATFLLLILL